MRTKLFSSLLALVFICACGRQVNISTRQLEYNSNLQNGSSITASQEGLLIRGVPDKIIVNSVTHNVSIYSSYLALEFIASKPLSTQMNVKFKGKLKNNEMVLEIIESK